MNKTMIKISGLILLTISNMFQVLSQSPEEMDFLNFSVIADPQVRYYTQEYNKLCPHTHMCDVLVDVDNSIFRISGMTTEVACCGRCECGNNCLNTLDCCPDRLPRLLTSEEVKDVYTNPVQCVRAQFRPYDQKRYNGRSYFMVTKCADNYLNKIVVENCKLEYTDFDFQEDIPNFLPVTDKTTNITYKNKYCASCNHISDSNLIYWEVEAGIFDTEVKIQKLADIQVLFAVDRASNVVFKIPRKLWDAAQQIQLCVNYIDRCNVTGLWEFEDPDVESLCVSYLSLYKGYKNIHCYMCNGFDESTIEQICDDSLGSGWRPTSFISLLDYNNLEPSEQGQDIVSGSNCNDNQLYDSWVGLCRNLSCPETTFLHQNECKSAITKISQAKFDFTLRLLPTKGYMDIRIIPTLKKYLDADIKIVDNTVISAERIYSDVQMFLKLNYSLSHRSDVTFLSVFKEDIQYIAVRFIISASEIDNVTAFVKEIKDLLLLLDFDITGGFDVEFANISFTLYERKLLAKFHTTQTLTPTPTTEMPLLPYDPEEHGFFEPFDDPLDDHGVLPVIPTSPFLYPNTIRIMPFLFCPYITLSNEDFTIQNGRKEIYFVHKKAYVNTSNIVFSKNDSTITLCSKDYFSQPLSDNIVQKPSTLYNAEVILSIVCTSVSMLSLVIVLVTYCIFRTLRTLPGLNNMGLSSSLFLAQLFYLLGGVIEITIDWLCKTLGVLLHLSLLTSFFWMLVCTFHMMRTFVFISKLSAPEDTCSKFIKYAAFVTLASAVLVVINIVVSVLDDSTIGYGVDSCYISSKYMIIYTVALPLGIIILSNLVMFVYVIIKVCNLPEVSKNVKHERNNIVIFAKLSTLTGLSWIFAYVYQWTEIKAFSYMFIITNASQGLFIMFSFIVNKRVINMVTSSYKSSSLYRTTNKTGLYSENRESRGRSQHIESNHL